MDQLGQDITYTMSQLYDPVKTTQKKFKILHIDDDENILYLSKKIIETQDPEFSVTSVSDPNYVLENHSKFDCIISDYQMPGINGIELNGTNYLSFDGIGNGDSLIISYGGEISSGTIIESTPSEKREPLYQENVAWSPIPRVN